LFIWLTFAVIVAPDKLQTKCNVFNVIPSTNNVMQRSCLFTYACRFERMHTIVHSRCKWVRMLGANRGSHEGCVCEWRCTGDST